MFSRQVFGVVVQGSVFLEVVGSKSCKVKQINEINRGHEFLAVCKFTLSIRY